MQSLFFAISPEFFLKQMRGLPNRSSKPIDLAYWVQRNFNTEHNPSIERSAEARIAEMDRLLQLEDVAQAHQAGVVHHQTGIAQILAHPESYELYCNIYLLRGGKPYQIIKF